MRVHIYGAAGYAAAELMRLLVRHPFAELGILASRSHANEPVGKHFPALRALGRTFVHPDRLLEGVETGDTVVLAADSGVAARVAPQLLDAGANVIDLSADFRIAGSHPLAVYGFPERYRDSIRDARLVANPGCYPTATLLATLPLANLGIDISSVIVDAKSGITGAGRTPALGSMFAEVDGEIRAYGLDGHRHEPEIAQEFLAAGLRAPLLFTPHVVPIRRGMLVDAYCTFDSAPEPASVHAAFVRAYDGNPFVRIVNGMAPSISAVVGSNDAELHVSQHGAVVRVICAIDNLGKGAAGQALQNFNIMNGYPEESGLNDCALAG